MKAGWQIKRLSEICDIERGGSPRPIDNFLTTDSKGINWIKIGDTKNVTKYITKTEEKIKPEGAKRSRLVYEGDFILSNSMSFGRPYIMKTTGCIHDGWLVLRQPKVDQDYLYHILGSDLVFSQFDRLAAGSTVRNLNIGLVKTVEIPFPPLPEQQRIVGILDEAFDGIATAKANAEKNLQNARALFESHLQSVFTQRGEGWVEKRFDELCVLQRGFDLPTHSRNKGNYPLVSSNGITDRINLWKVKAPGVVTGRSGTIGNVHYIQEDFWPLNTSLYIKEFHGNCEKCIYYFLKQFDLNQYSSGAGVPTLNRNNVHCERVYFPQSLSEQKQIVAKLDLLREETDRLESIYQRKIAALDELKKSLLHQAFSGEL